MRKILSFYSTKIHDEKSLSKCNKDNIINIDDDNQPSKTTLNDQDNNNDPQNWPAWRKRLILLVVSFATMTSSISSSSVFIYLRVWLIIFIILFLLAFYLFKLFLWKSILYPTLLKLRAEFNASDMEVNALGK